MNKCITLLLLVLALSSCSRDSTIHVQTIYLTKERLASYYVGTPDPQLLNPPIGQQILISWSVPFDYLEYEDLHLHIRVRLRNHQEVVVDYPIAKRCGSYTYQVTDEEYLACKGILTYKVDLMSGDTLLEEWKHQLWHELIVIGAE